eukprot:CAMPEP_0206473054 /NCGR_PEP_ID=MMETSP0324_2-20121206/32607_1 /ASSEMBLY_ACC=CAM_ASM_000836 /TAXON_ID=2866 /ORGANISM="Crypthecodinium cohnii, Strain Seligo" /LENGTH=49 /DNA_ID=CAMNT_0053947851 /DNA_START=422 /DNA_END=571 /DNA_ORIENTATION=-
MHACVQSFLLVKAGNLQSDFVVNRRRLASMLSKRQSQDDAAFLFSNCDT